VQFSEDVEEKSEAFCLMHEENASDTLRDTRYAPSSESEALANEKHMKLILQEGDK